MKPDVLTLCGDATQPATYTRLLGDEKADLLLTDPPYCLLTRRRKGGDLRDPKGRKIDRHPVVRFETVRDYEDWIARLDSIGGYVDQTIALMRAGMAEKRVQPRKVMERVPGQIAAQLVSTPDASPFYKPFREFADSVPEAERERLARAAQAAITRSVLRASPPVTMPCM